MKKLCLRLVIIGAVLLGVTGLSHAFLYEVNVMEPTAIQQLTDQKLIDAYLDLLVELKAATTFHSKAGFTTRDYPRYKALLRYKVDLLVEFRKRQLEVPDINL